jgi:2-C-methyl-D-erythritol 4-phosphate cytidylyltransferase
VVSRPISAKVALVMPAAGGGRRLGLDLPKALVDIAGRPMICRALEPFASVPGIVEVVVLVPAKARAAFQDALASTVIGGAAPRVLAGGGTRQDSVRLGVEALQSFADIICVHDAARPLVTAKLISTVIAAAGRGRAATAATRPVDSVRQDVAGGTSRAIDRSSFWLVQTPQAFPARLLRDAHRRAEAEAVVATDDASLVEQVCGADVMVVPNDTPNPKVTTVTDLAFVCGLLR